MVPLTHEFYMCGVGLDLTSPGLWGFAFCVRGPFSGKEICAMWPLAFLVIPPVVPGFREFCARGPSSGCYKYMKHWYRNAQLYCT